MDQHLSFSSAKGSPKKTAKVGAAPKRERKAHFEDVEVTHVASPVRKGKKKKGGNDITVPIAYSAPDDADVIIRQDKVSARRRRLLRQKKCRNTFCCVWIFFVSFVLAVTAMFYYSEESNTDLLNRIKLLEARITAEETLQAINHEGLDNRESSNTQRHDQDIGDLSDKLNVQIVRIDELKDAEAQATQNVADLRVDVDSNIARLAVLEDDRDFHDARLQNLEADTGQTIERTQALEAFANQTLGRTQTLEILMDDTIQRVADLEDISDVTVARVAALETLTNSTEGRVTALEEQVANHSTRLVVLEADSSAVLGRVTVLEGQANSLVGQVSTLEGTSALTVISLKQARDTHLPNRPLRQMVSPSTALRSMVDVQPDGWVATGSQDASFTVWNVFTGEEMGTFVDAHTASVTALVLLSDGIHMCSGSEDQRLSRWDISVVPPVLRHTWTAHTQTVTTLARLPGSLSLVVSGSADGQLKVWDSRPPGGGGTTVALRTLGALGDPTVTAVAVLDSGHIVSGNQDGGMTVWDLLLDVARNTFEAGSTMHAMALLSPDLRTGVRRIAVATFAGSIGIWDPDTGDNLGYYEPNGGAVSSTSYYSLALLPDQTLAAGNNNGLIHLFDTRDGDLLGELTFDESRLEPSVASPTDRRVEFLTVLHDGTLVSGDDQRVLTVWRSGLSESHLFS